MSFAMIPASFSDIKYKYLYIKFCSKNNNKLPRNAHNELNLSTIK